MGDDCSSYAKAKCSYIARISGTRHFVNEVPFAVRSKRRTQATQDLIEAAATKWREVEGDYRDDITAVVIRLPCFPE